LSLRLSVVVINYRTPELTLGCLESLESELDFSRDAVMLVDNASPDGSADVLGEEILRRRWDPWVRLIRSPVNGGFSAGNNLGVRAASAKYHLLLNSDALVRPGAVEALLREADKHPRAGLTSPRLEWPDGTPQISCFRYHSPLSQLVDAAGTSLVTRLFSSRDVPLPVGDEPSEPPWTSFACVLLRGEAFRDVGPMDEGYFLFFEDVDYCRRVRAKGWSILHFPAARVVHLRGGSSTVKRSAAARRRLPSYYYASRRRYFRKFYGKGGWVAANLLWTVGRAVALARELAGNKEPHHCDHAFADVWMK